MKYATYNVVLFVLVFSFSILAQTTLVVTQGSATLDGVISPGEYTSTPLVTPLATLYAMDDGVNFYLAATWADATESIAKKQWFFDGATWTQSENEDRFGIIFDMGLNDPEGVNCLSMCHPPLMHTSIGYVDVWHWKAYRSNPMGVADDKRWETDDRHSDSGTSSYSDNGPVNNLPGFMAISDPGANVDFIVESASLGNYDPYGVMSSTFAESTAFDTTATFSNGDVVPGYVLRTSSGDRGNVMAAGKWDSGVWTVEFKRTNSGSDYDFTVPIGGTVDFTHEIFDNTGSGHPSDGFDATVYTLDFSGIIPVELTSFTAKALDGVVYLNWTTATEQNNLGFEVERRVDGDYSKIGFISGHGTTTEIQNYTFTDEELESGTYFYRLKQLDYDGSFEYSSEVKVEILTPTYFTLKQNYPNPFNPNTTISFSIPNESNVIMKVFDLVGNEVKTLVNEKFSAGIYTVEFDAANLPSGVYFYQLEAGDFVNTKKMVIMK
jgi:hypothetical protein